MATTLIVDGRTHEVEIVRRRPNLVLSIDGREHEIAGTGTSADGRRSIELGGRELDFARAHMGENVVVRLDGRTFEVAIVDPRAAAEGAGGGQDVIRAPMPGTVVSVQKSAGESVKRGETVITIESMKLQTALPAPRDGAIEALLKREGETFEKDEVIVRLKAASEEA
jgi:biotin carboxyl carrier protein